MKIAIRALVLGMLITGFAANHMLASNSASNNSKKVVVASNSAAPMPSCEPGTSCGSDKW